MRTGQGKVAGVVIERGILPVGWIMAGGAIRAILTVMGIVRLVAGKAVHGRACVLAVCMAGLATYFGVLALQFERGQVMIELGGDPTIRSVALAAIRSKAALVRLVVEVTRITILPRHREIPNATRVDMALHTGEPHMLAGQLKGKEAVVEVLSKTVDAVMAIATG